jgi:circadian clock protein KaiB
LDWIYSPWNKQSIELLEMKKQSKKQIDEFKKKVESSENEKYVLKLYVTGATPNSIHSIQNIKKICEEYLGDRYELEVIDIYQQPILAQGEQIIAAPTLVKKLPLPLRRLIGDLSDTDKVLLGLNIKKK